MASWADQISQFNPYIQQLPVEAMTQVGMYKQQKYDEGIQKVQSYIDNVAGLDVVKPLQKAYLQTKLNELGSKLKTVAAGDFSNYQLVNSVGGMATQIVKDPIVQSAVTSTQMFRKGQQDLETARKAGKNSIQNEAWWNKTTNDWMDDGNLNSPFSGRYIEYRDMEKKLRDVAKEIHEYDKSVEIPFKRDNDGNVLYFYKDAKGNKIATTDPSSGGTPETDEAILKMRVKGKAAQTILDNFYTSLDEDDKQQLGIDGWHHYRNYSGDGFRNKVKQDITATYNEKKAFISDRIATLAAELSTNTKLTKDQKDKIQTQINEYSALSKGGGLDKQLAKRLESVDMADELSLKQSVYTEKFLTTLAGNIAYQDLETEYKTNPYQRALMDRKELEFKYWNAQRNQRNEDRKYGLEVAKYNLKVEAQRAKSAKDLKDLYGEDSVWEPSGLTTDKELPTMTDLSSAITALDDEMDAFRVKYGPQLLNNYNDLTPVEQRASLKKTLDDYLKDPKTIGNNNKKKLIERYRSMQTDMTRRMSNYMAIAEKSKVYDERLEQLIKSEAPVRDSKGVVHSAQDAMRVLNDMKSKVDLKERKTKEGPVYEKDFSKVIAEYKGTKYEGILTDLMRDETYLRTFDRKVGSAADRIYREKKAFEQQEIGKMLPQYQTSVSALNMEDKSAKESVEKVIGGMYALYNSLGALDTKTKSEFNPDTITEWRSGKGKGDLKYVIKKSQDNSSAYLEIYKGKQVQRIPLNSRQFAAYFPSAAQTKPMETIKYLVQGSPMKTTNAMNLTDGSEKAAINAAFTGENLPLFAGTGLASLVRFDVEGDDENDGGDNDLFQVRMYVNDNGVWKSDIVNKAGYGTYGSIQKMMNDIGVTEYERIKNMK